jgi:hypothetical protein
MRLDLEASPRLPAPSWYTSMEQYECCICKKIVSSREQSHDLDPCGLVLIGNIDGPYDLRRTQDFYCHFECFRKLVNDDEIMYIMEPEDD